MNMRNTRILKARQYLLGIKIPNWLILETVLYGYGYKHGLLLIYMSIMRRASLMMNGMYKATLSVDDIVEDWDFDELNAIYFSDLKPMSFYLSKFNELVSKYTALIAPDPYDMVMGGDHTYMIKAAHGSFGEGHEVYFTDDEIYRLIHYTEGRKDNLVLVLCYIRLRIPSVTDDSKGKVAVAGKDRMSTNFNIDYREVCRIIEFLKSASMVDFYKEYQYDENGNRVNNSRYPRYKDPYVPIFALPEMADKNDAYKCGLEFFEYKREQREGRMRKR